MSVTDGQLADASDFNAAFVSKNTDDTKTGKLNLADASSATVTDVQATINLKAATTYVDTQDAATLASAHTYTDSQVTALLGGAPGALNTLEKLADALNDDASLATDLTNSLTLKAPIASPTFTGTVTSPAFSGPLTGNVTGNVSGSAGSFTGSLSGDVTGTQSATAIAPATVTGKVLTGLSTTAGTPTATDTILSAIGKNTGQVTANTSNIATNTSNIATNTSNISANTSAIALKANAANPALTGAITLTETTTPSAPSSGALKLYAKTDDKLYYQTSAGVESAVGSGSGTSSGGGAVNYVSNPDAATGLATGWNGFAGSGAFVDGTGGTNPVTLFAQQNSSTSPIISKNGYFYFNLDDSPGYAFIGWSTDMYIAEEDRGKVLEAGLSYTLAQNSSGADNYADGNISLALYDITNGAIVQFIENPAIPKVTEGLVSKFTARFQCPYNCAQLRLALVKTTTNNDYKFKFSSAHVSPQLVSRGAAITDFVSYTPTLTTFGSGYTIAKSMWRRVGDCVEIQGIVLCGSSPSGNTFIPLPAGMVTDSAKLSSGGVYTIVGSANQDNQSVSVFPIATASDTGFYFGYENTTTASTSSLPQVMNVAGHYLGYTVKIPIQGWSSNIAMSTDASGQQARFSASKNSTQSLSGSVTNKIVWNVVNKDNLGGYNGAGDYVVKSPGDYVVSGVVQVYGGTSGDNYVVCSATGKTDQTQYSPYSSSGNFPFNAFFPDMKVGDLISVGVIPTTASTTGGSGSPYNFVSIYKADNGSQQIAATERICATYGLTTNYSHSANTVIKYDTKVEDTHGLFSIASGLLTSNFNGKLVILHTGNATTTSTFYVKKNGVAAGTLAAGTVNFAVSSAIEILVSVGDTVGVYNDDNNTINGSGTYGFANQVTFKRAT